MTQYNIIETGSYAGNGGTQTVTIGWQPGLVICGDNQSTGNKDNRATGFKTGSMSGGDYSAHSDDGEWNQDGSITITSTGFQVGAGQLNESGETDYWVAVKEGPWIQHGTYTGNGSDPQTITLGRQPLTLWIFQADSPGGGKILEYKTDTMSSGDVFQYQFNLDKVASVVSLTSTGFQVSANANTNTITYQYIAFFFHSPTVRFRSESYSGDGGTGRAVTLGQQPRYAWTYRDQGIALTQSFWKNAQITSGDFIELGGDHDYTSSTNQMVFTSTGLTVSGNSNTSSQTYHNIYFV